MNRTTSSKRTLAARKGGGTDFFLYSYFTAYMYSTEAPRQRVQDAGGGGLRLLLWPIGGGVCVEWINRPWGRHR